VSTRTERDLSLAIVGVAGGLLGGVTMNLFARLVRSTNHGREADGAAPGVERDGRGVQPPQADRHSEDDATVRVGTTVYQTIAGTQPSDDTKQWLGSAAHYGFSAALGVMYALAIERAPMLRAGFGTLYGTLVWAIADEAVMPALGLSRGPREQPLGVHAYALSGHWVFGATLECVRRLGESFWNTRSGSNAATA
jgi:uncharacterized membrane protein YagU involved in acid resistance